MAARPFRQGAEPSQRGTSAKADDVDVVFRFADVDSEGFMTLVRTHTRLSWVPREVKLRETEPCCATCWLRRRMAAAPPSPLLEDLGVPVDTTQREAMRSRLRERRKERLPDGDGDRRHQVPEGAAVTLHLDALHTGIRWESHAGITAGNHGWNHRESPPVTTPLTCDDSRESRVGITGNQGQRTLGIRMPLSRGHHDSSAVGRLRP